MSKKQKIFQLQLRQNNKIYKYIFLFNHLKLLSGFFVFCLLLYFLNIAGAQENKKNAPAYGDAIVVGALGDARTLIPILASDSSSAEICHFLFNGLLKYDKDLNLTGDLALNWEILDSGLRIVFHLRKGVRWHDGKEFTADDVKFTFDKLRDPNIKTPYSGDFLKVKALKIIDPYTLEVYYDEPFSPGLASWGMWIMPKHILEKEDLNSNYFSDHPIGTGPYKWGRWKKQDKIELFANKDYFQGRPFISRYIYRVIPDQTTLFLEIETKNVDYIALTPLQYTRQTDSEFFKKNYAKYRTPGFGYTYLGYNLKNELFKDKRVRQALNYAVNKDEIIRINLLGLGELTTGPFLPQSWAYDRNVKDVGFNPKKALLLLQDAGWRDRNNDGYLEKNGRIFEFTLLTNQGNELRIKTAELIQKYLKNIGIRVKIKVLEWSSLLSHFIDKRRFEAVLLGWSLSRDPDCYDIWHSSKQKEGEFNFLSYENKDVDDSLEKARRTFDNEQRAGYYHKIHAILYDDQPCMFLFVPDSLEIISSRFKGVVPSVSGIGYNFITWRVPKEEQRYKNYLEK